MYIDIITKIKHKVLSEDFDQVKNSEIVIKKTGHNTFLYSTNSENILVDNKCDIN
jgi:hypothetical protein